MTAVVSTCLRCRESGVPCGCDVEWGAEWGAEPADHVARRVHPVAMPGCRWCEASGCRCGAGCADAAECYRRFASSETSWREMAAGVALYGRRQW